MSFEDLVGRWPKECRGCETPWSESEWVELSIVSVSPLEPGVHVELRRCRCGEVLGAAVAARHAQRR